MHPFALALHSLRFDRDESELLHHIKHGQWPPLLQLTDKARLTLPLGIRLHDKLPDPVRRRIAASLAANAIRCERTIAACRELMQVLDRHGIPFLFLKGLSHFPYFCSDLRYRQQYDIDLYSSPENLAAMLRAVTALGYRPVDRGSQARADHLPVMIRQTGWLWRGDYYDPEMPLALELHFRLWDPQMEQFELGGAEQMWERRESRNAGVLQLPTLSLQDTFRYAAWHVVRHLFRGDVSAGHVYELAHFLNQSAEDHSFWAAWRRAQPEDCLGEALAASLAFHCFGCSLHATIKDLIDELPAPVRKWFDLFALSPLMSVAQPNKDELFLHLLLARRGRFAIAMRRLFPSFPSRFVRAPHTGHSDPRIRRWADQFCFLTRRTAHHLRSAWPLARSGARFIRELG